ncbi:ketosynthase chain-length factor [Flexivirga sp. ID2601S]|uniref:Ketosynthase chain-length factor n=1 Tax=Flexivirga aerilata TaxID=1656889 RepID=A0A849ABJ3_9MICO|nr:ketosynthase chain-length factor [Flexivirga aerilata]
MAGCAITGLGVVAPTGIGVPEYWQATTSGRSGIHPVTRFDASGYVGGLAGEVPGFTAADHIPARLLPQTDHVTRLSLVAASEALSSSGLHAESVAEFGIGISTASTLGGFEFGQRELEHLWGLGREHVSAYQSFAWFYAVNTGQVSIRHGLRGPGSTVVTDQAGGLDALGAARRQVRGGTPVVVAGAVDGGLCPLGWAGFQSAGRLSRDADPASAYTPFAASADGHVPGEGGAYLIVEDSEHAAARGAHVLGTITGYAATFDPDPEDPVADGLSRAAVLALDDAGVDTTDIDVVFPDAAGHAPADRAEAAAIIGLFGPGGVPISIPKTGTGRLLAGAGTLDAASALLAIESSVIPPAATHLPPHEGLDLVTEPRATRVRHALVLARGSGGFNAALVVSAPDAHSD